MSHAIVTAAMCEGVRALASQGITRHPLPRAAPCCAEVIGFTMLYLVLFALLLAVLWVIAKVLAVVAAAVFTAMLVVFGVAVLLAVIRRVRRSQRPANPDPPSRF